MLEWYSNFVPEANGNVLLFLDPARLNTALVRPLHRGSTLNDVLPRLAGVKCFALINRSSGYHKLKL